MRSGLKQVAQRQGSPGRHASVSEGGEPDRGGSPKANSDRGEQADQASWSIPQPPTSTAQSSPTSAISSDNTAISVAFITRCAE